MGTNQNRPKYRNLERESIVEMQMTQASTHYESVARSTRSLFKTVATLWHLRSVEREKTPSG